MTNDNPLEDDEQEFTVTEDGKLEPTDDHEANFEEDLTFDD